MLGEVFNFFLGKISKGILENFRSFTNNHYGVEHSLILIVPMYLISNPRYVTIPPSLDMALFSFFLYAFYHSPVLHLFSLWSGYNLNYSLVPPARKWILKNDNSEMF